MIAPPDLLEWAHVDKQLGGTLKQLGGTLKHLAERRGSLADQAGVDGAAQRQPGETDRP